MDIRIIMQKVSQRFTYLENLIFDQIGTIGKGVSSPIVLISMCRRVPIFVYKTAGNEAISSGFDSTLIQGQPSDKPGALKKVNGTDAYRTIGTKRFQSRQDLKIKRILLFLRLFCFSSFSSCQVVNLQSLTLDSSANASNEEKYLTNKFSLFGFYFVYFIKIESL